MRVSGFSQPKPNSTLPCTHPSRANVLCLLTTSPHALLPCSATGLTVGYISLLKLIKWTFCLSLHTPYFVILGLGASIRKPFFIKTLISLFWWLIAENFLDNKRKRNLKWTFHYWHEHLNIITWIRDHFGPVP